jgi:DNA-binding NtrC family response regulator
MLSQRGTSNATTVTTRTCSVRERFEFEGFCLEGTRYPMSASAKNVHSSLQSQENISILLVSPDVNDEVELRNILTTQGGSLLRHATVKDALPHLDSATVVMCERDLPDGTWQSVLNECDGCPNRPLVMVVSRHADERLWAEVLNLGGYDVLLKPFDRNEVTRVVAMCGSQWGGRNARQPVRSEPASLPFLAAQLA